MSAARVICDDCEGERERFGIKCAGCDGQGTVPVPVPTPDHDNLVVLLAPVCDAGTARAALERLDNHRAELAAWLVEIGFLRYTNYGIEPVPRNPTLGPRDKGYIEPGTSRFIDAADLGPHGRRLWTVDA